MNFMADVGEYYYLESTKLNSKMLRIPYAGRKFAMFLILPNKGVSLSAVADQMDHKSVNREAWYLDLHTVSVKLPRFSINYPIDLKPYLQEVNFEFFT